MIEIKNLWKTFGDKSVLKGIDLKIEKGKVFAIIGPSGTGKSTLLRCLNVLERADKGSIVLGDKEIDFTKMSKMRYSDSSHAYGNGISKFKLIQK